MHIDTNIYIYIRMAQSGTIASSHPTQGFEGRKHCWDGWRLTFERCCVHGEDLDGATLLSPELWPSFGE